jgi:hypothetical protein
MDNINELFNLIDRVPKYLYNIGVGQLPHREAEHFKSRYPDINVVGLEPQSSQYIARKPDYPGELYPWALWHGACLKELNLTTDSGNARLLQVEQLHTTGCLRFCNGQPARYILVDGYRRL